MITMIQVYIVSKYLYELGAEQEQKWTVYLERLKEAGHARKEH